jgi:hypothetical protein
MSPEEVVDLLTLVASYDRRTVGEADVDAWLMATGDLPFDDAKVAVVKHYRESREWLMPVDVRRHVRAIREARIAAKPIPAPDPDLAANEAQYRKALMRIRTQIGNGTVWPKAIPAGGGAEPTEDYQQHRSDDDRARVLAQTVPCPVEGCPALVAEPCVNRGAGQKMKSFHPERLAAARQAREAS